MTTDAIYGERGFDWYLPWGQLDGCNVTRPFLSLQRVWLARLISLMVNPGQECITSITSWNTHLACRSETLRLKVHSYYNYFLSCIHYIHVATHTCNCFEDKSFYSIRKTVPVLLDTPQVQFLGWRVHILADPAATSQIVTSWPSCLWNTVRTYWS